jgi:hypothetical protein
MKAFKYKPTPNLTAEQAKVYQDNWNLSEVERENLDNYFLRQWSEIELVSNIGINHKGMPVISIWNTDYIPVFTGKDMAIWDRICYLAANGYDPKPDPINNKYPMYWCSFRSGLVEGKRFSYVIIQEDRK